MKHSSSRGNILFLILIAVALFAALSYAVTSSSRSGASSITKEKIKLYASELVQHMAEIEQAITRVKIFNGCSDTQLSFYHADGAYNYTNPNSPSDNRCHIFHPDGGGVAFRENYFVNQTPPGVTSNNPFLRFASGSELLNVGRSSCGDDSCTELYLFFDIIGENKNLLCEEFNKQFGHDDLVPAPSTAYVLSGPVFVGTYNGGHAVNATAFDGKRNFCYEYIVDTTRAFYIHTLLAR